VSIIAESQGLFDTIQDAGRPGYRSFGVPLGGWFDAWHAALANALAGNTPEAPCLEVTLRSCAYRVTARHRIAVVGPGAVVEVTRGGREFGTWTESISLTLEPGDTYRIHHPVRGFRSYVAVAGGGWQGCRILNSVSSETRILAGAEIQAVSNSQQSIHSNLRLRLAPPIGVPDSDELAFVASREFSALDRSIERFGRFAWKVSSRSDRIGVRFDPVPVDGVSFSWSEDSGRLSEPVVPGTIQWTGSELIMLGVAGGTMGGYPVLGYLVNQDLSRLAQMRSGAIVRLRHVFVEQASELTERYAEERDAFVAMVRLAASGGHVRTGVIATD
jgi:antagonist of KipI